MKTRFGSITFVVLLLLAPALSLAQSRNTGAIQGIVTDETGGRIPGVLVVIASPDMIGGSKAMTTDKNGNYRFPELPPGVFTITYGIEGYQTVKHENVRIEAAKTFDLPIQLTPRAGEETIIVSSQSPLVDVTSAGTTTNFNDEYLQNLPTGRFQPATLNLAPGIENSSAYGGGASKNAYQIDGVDVSDPEGGSPWSFLNYNIIKEVQLIGLGAPAEYGGFTGVLFNSVTRSGSNDFSGLAEGYLFPTSWVASNTVDPGIVPPKIDRSYDSTFQVGGPFKKDRLWYFVSAQYLYDARSTGGPLRTEKDPRLFGKLTWQINKDNLFEFWGEYDRFDITGRGGDGQHPIETTVTESAPELVWNFSWRRIISPNTSFNLAYTGYTGYYYLDPASGYKDSGRFDSNGDATVNSLFWYKADRYRHDMVATVSHYSDTFLTGKHDFKYGAELERSRVRSRDAIPGTAYYYDYLGNPSSDPNQYVAPVTYAYIGYNYDLKAVNQRVSAFVQDKWQINDRWTVEPGVRVDMNRGSVPGQANVFRTTPIAPRIGFAFDLTGKKKTVLKGHYGRYFDPLLGNYFEGIGPGRLTLPDQYAFAPGTPFDKNNPDPAFLVVPSRQQKVILDGNLKQPYVDQYVLSVEHDLGNDFSLKLDVVHRKNKDFIESVSLDGDFTKVTALDDRGRRVKLFNQGNLNDTLIITNPDVLKRDYNALILTATKRLSKRWQMLASYARAHATGNIDNTFARSAGPSTFLDTPNSLVNAQGNLTHDYRDEFTVQGQYIIPKVEVTVSGDYRYVSGQNFTATGTANCFLTDPTDPNTCTGSFNQGSRIRYLGEPRGSRRLDATNNLNLRAEKFFAFNGGTRLGIFADVFNVLNRGEDTSVTAIRGSSSFGNVLSISEARQWRLGARYSW